jgi:hypothetical protein
MIDTGLRRLLPENALEIILRIFATINSPIRAIVVKKFGDGGAVPLMTIDRNRCILLG